MAGHGGKVLGSYSRTKRGNKSIYAGGFKGKRPSGKVGASAKASSNFGSGMKGKYV